MIDIQEVLRRVPHFDTFCSVEKLHALAERLRSEPGFEVATVGRSGNGVPIYHVRYGSGSVKALFVAFPHCMEPIGGLTAFSLMSLLEQKTRALVEADVEWHIVPCIDPDGALLNEGWTQKPFSFENYMKNYYVEECAGQVDMSFPIHHKKMVWDKPSIEARVLQRLLDSIRPDFFFSLHNTRIGGAFYYISHDIGREFYDQIYSLLATLRFPVQKRPQWKEVFAEYGPGILEQFSTRKYYDYLESVLPSPEKENILQFGRHSVDYMADIKPGALTFTAETGYVLHPGAESEKIVGGNLRHFMLRLDADNKYLATVLLEEWDKLRDGLDPANPFYRTVTSGWVLPSKDTLHEGGVPISRLPTRDILFNPQYDRVMTEADLFNACMVDSGFFYHLFSYQFVRLLKSSPQTAAVQRSLARLEKAFGDAHAELTKHVDFEAFEVIECDTLAKVQIGSGLIALNSVLAGRRA